MILLQVKFDFDVLIKPSAFWFRFMEAAKVFMD